MSEPTPEQLTAMAYVDGELDPAARRAFEERLPGSPELRREVSELQRLAVLSRQVAGPEPMDFEWRALADDPLHSNATRVGYAALALGALGMFLVALIGVVRSDAAALVKVLLVSGALGFALLLFTSVRARLRTLPHDPYRHVQR